MPRFMLVLLEDDTVPVSPELAQELVDRYWRWTEQIKAEGHYLNGDALKLGGAIVTVDAGQITDGPYTESKESVGGFYIIQAPDLAAATEIAKGCPVLTHGGWVQVREIQEWD